MKTLAIAAVVAAALVSVTPALARGGHHSSTGGSHLSSHSFSHSHSSGTTSRSSHVGTGHSRSSVVARDSHGRIKRSTAAKDDFKRERPCPSTGRSSGACPGYVIDHVVPLKRGGADAPGNMQWQTAADAKAKDKWE